MGKPAPPKPLGSRAKARDSVVELPLVDARGRAAPGAFGRELPRGPSGQRSDHFDADGNRTKYFDDDDGADVNTLLKRTRHGDDGCDVDAAIAGHIARKKRFKGSDLNPDDEYDFDTGVEMLQRKAGKGKRPGRGTPGDRLKGRQIADLKKLNAVEESCPFCFSCPRRPKHLVVAIGNLAYLRLPERGRLVPGHCMIAPLEHTPSTRRLDEDAWTEVRNFKKALMQTFHAKDRDVLFMETALKLGDYKRHAVVECLPLPHAAMTKAPMYFKAGIDNATSDWSQHHAKRIIETGRKGLHGSIPPNFPYFFVEFGLSNGYVHVVDDESRFDANFGRKVIGGLLKLLPEAVEGRRKSENMRTHEEWMKEFLKDWEPFDWTKMLG